MREMRFVAFVLIALVAATGSAPAASDTVLAHVRYPEGPLWRDGTLFFTEMRRDRVAMWDGTKVSSFWRERGCGPTAIVPFGEVGFVILCHLGGYLVHVDPSGAVIARFDGDDSGRPLHDPNDATPDGAGGLYFSDAGVFRQGAPATGTILHLDNSGHMKRVAGNLYYANGVFFDAQSRRLYVSEHLARRILLFDIASNGTLENKRVFIDLDRDGPPLRRTYAESGPDGLELDSEDVLWVCEYGQGRVLAIDKSGRLLGQAFLATPFLTNIAIGADDRVALTGAFSNTSAHARGEVRILPLAMLRQSAGVASAAK